jgi:hypothetical protein
MGCIIAGIYVIECKKRALPHAHILIFFAKDYKSHMVEDVDGMINDEFPNPETNKLVHEIVAKCMMHGPCGAAFSKCPMHGRWQMQKKYPRKFQCKTVMDVNKYPIY